MKVAHDRECNLLTNLTSKSPQSPADRLNKLRNRVETEFQSRFSRPPAIFAAAPGRVNLIGEHVDYNDGFVLPMAIERYVVIAAAPLTDPAPAVANVYSVNLQEAAQVPLKSSQPTLVNWARYLEGVVAGFSELGVDVPPFDAVLSSDIPAGGGLSSSAALEVAMATLLESLTGRKLDPQDKALLCQRAEHRFAGVPCGIMDQFSSVFGKQNELMLLDCRTQEIDPVAFQADDVSVLITNSNVSHKLADGEYGKRRAQCDSALKKLNKSSWRDVSMTDVESSRDLLDAEEFSRAQHVVSEIERTMQAATAVRASDWKQFGELMYASHASLRDQYEVSCDELDVLVELAASAGTIGGVYGSRMTGGGFGGCTVSLVQTANVAPITEFLHAHYESKTGIKAHSFASRPAIGAHLMQTD